MGKFLDVTKRLALATGLLMFLTVSAVAVAAGRASVHVRLELSSSDAKNGVLLEATIHVPRGTRCALTVVPPRHLHGLPSRFVISRLVANRRSRVQGTLLLSLAAPAGRWMVRAACSHRKLIAMRPPAFASGRGAVPSVALTSALFVRPRTRARDA